MIIESLGECNHVPCRWLEEVERGCDGATRNVPGRSRYKMAALAETSPTKAYLMDDKKPPKLDPWSRDV